MRACFVQCGRQLFIGGHAIVQPATTQSAGPLQKARERYIELGHTLKSLRPGPKRSRVVQQMSRLEAD